MQQLKYYEFKFQLNLKLLTSEKLLLGCVAIYKELLTER